MEVYYRHHALMCSVKSNCQHHSGNLLPTAQALKKSSNRRNTEFSQFHHVIFIAVRLETSGKQSTEYSFLGLLHSVLGFFLEEVNGRLESHSTLPDGRFIGTISEISLTVMNVFVNLILTIFP